MNAPNLNAVLATYLAEVQELENAITGVAVCRLIDSAWGKQLDIVGAWAGIPRNDIDDTIYRAAIKVKWFENNSSGQTDQMTYIAQQLCGATSVKYEPPTRPGFYSLLVTGGSIADPILSNLQALSPLGVQLYALHRGALRPFHMTDHMTQALLHE